MGRHRREERAQRIEAAGRGAEGDHRERGNGARVGSVGSREGVQGVPRET
jgi:hypothetical protein